MSKVRRVDYYADEYISGVAGVLKGVEQAVYWMICSLVISEGGLIVRNEERIAMLCGVRVSEARKIVQKLIDLGKITVDSEGKLAQKRALSEVERASKRIQTASENGGKGGRSPKKAEQNQGGAKAGGFSSEKLTTTTNHQQTTTNLPPTPNGGGDLFGSVEEEPDPPAERTSDAPASDDVTAAVEAYNEVAARAGLPKAQVLNDKRRKRLRERLKECGGLPVWRAALAKIPAIGGLCGENDRGWRADLDFLCQADSFAKLLEGGYDHWSPRTPPANGKAPVAYDIAAYGAAQDRWETDGCVGDPPRREDFTLNAGGAACH